MCGIAGIWDQNQDVKTLRGRLDAALGLQQHRGPDDTGLWIAPEGNVLLGHRRLSILDLSDSAGQPMIRSQGQFVLVFNGEIYNFQTLRSDPELRSAGPWESSGDTEVLLRALQVWGPEALPRLDGMFALAFYDVQERTLLLARDPFGEKPLYLATASGPSWYFSTTLTSLVSMLPRTPELDDAALASYWKQFAITSPSTVYRDVEAVRPGSWVCLSDRGREEGFYWQPEYCATQSGSFDETVRAVNTTLHESLQRRLLADVPIGCFLSGGVDSSLTTAMVAADFQQQLDTFSVGFEGQQSADRLFAERVSRQYGTRHHEMLLDADALEPLPQILWHYGQPFADFSCVPTFHVARLARTRVTVAVTGDGADELFGGYVTTLANDLVGKIRRCLPSPLRRLTRSCTSPLVRHRRGSLMRRLGVLAAMAAAEPEEAYDLLYGWHSIRKPHEDCSTVPTWRQRYFDEHPDWSVLHRTLYCELRGRLVDKFLVKVDVAAMANSLETRTPFLSCDLFHQVNHLEGSILLRRNTRKAVLKKVAEAYLPCDQIYRTKQGFTPPLDRWLLDARFSGLMEWITGRESPAAPWLDMDTLGGMWRDHKLERQNYATELFGVLSFALWWRLFVSRDLTPNTPLSEVTVS